MFSYLRPPNSNNMWIFLLVLYVLSFFAARWASLEICKRELRSGEPPELWVIFWFLPGVNTIMAIMLSLVASVMVLDTDRTFRDWLNGRKQRDDTSV